MQAHALIIDMGLYIVGAMICQIVATYIFTNTKYSKIGNIFTIAGFIIIVMNFMLFTYVTPQLPIFRDENTGN
jgi:hypothetical protein